MLYKNSTIILSMLYIVFHYSYSFSQYSHDNTGILKQRTAFKQNKNNLQDLFDTIGVTTQQEALQKLNGINNLLSTIGAHSIQDVILNIQQLQKNLKKTETQISLYQQKASDQIRSENELHKNISLLCSALDTNNIENALQKIETMKIEYKNFQLWKKKLITTLNDFDKLKK